MVFSVFSSEHTGILLASGDIDPKLEYGLPFFRIEEGKGGFGDSFKNAWLLPIPLQHRRRLLQGAGRRAVAYRRKSDDLEKVAKGVQRPFGDGSCLG